MKRVRVIYGLVLWFLITVSCGIPATKRNLRAAPACKDCNVILIAINNVGAEHMSLYEYQRKTTPYIDTWSKAALVFEQAYAPTSWTLPVITSVFTGLYPYTHKVMDRWHGNILDSSIVTLPTLLRKQGYSTAAFTGALDNKKIFGHMHGFETIDDNPNFTGFEVTIPQAEQWLKEHGTGKFFLFIHGYNAHAPFIPPEPFRGVFSSKSRSTIDPNIILRGYRSQSQNGEDVYIAQYVIGEHTYVDATPDKQELMKKKFTLNQIDIDFMRSLYDEDVLWVDSLVGGFLKRLPAAITGKTVIVIFSEHGEMFAKHGRFGRAGAIRGTLYDDVVRVPMLIKVPGYGPKRVRGFTQLVDLMPTLCEILDISLPKEVQGKSLIPLIAGGQGVNERVYSGSIFNVGRPSPHPYFRMQTINESVRDDQWKLIREISFARYANGGVIERFNKDRKAIELYDIQRDPDEQNNIALQNPQVVQMLEKDLERWKTQCERFLPSRVETQEIPEEMTRDARKHGYW